MNKCIVTLIALCAFNQQAIVASQRAQAQVAAALVQAGVSAPQAASVAAAAAQLAAPAAQLASSVASSPAGSPARPLGATPDKKNERALAIQKSKAFKSKKDHINAKCNKTLFGQK